MAGVVPAEPKGRHAWVIAYDVSNNSRRRRLGNLLAAYGWRIQRSVFVVQLSHKQRERLQEGIAGIVDPATDAIAMTRQCSACGELSWFVGAGSLHPSERGWIIL